jgi:hypothetical protein
MSEDGNNRRNKEDWRITRGYRVAPVLMRDLREKGRVLEVHCNDCAHFAELNAKTLPLPDDLPVPEAFPNFKCSRCGSTSIMTRPQTGRETVAVTRAKAQEHQRATLAAMQAMRVFENRE